MFAPEVLCTVRETAKHVGAWLREHHNWTVYYSAAPDNCDAKHIKHILVIEVAEEVFETFRRSTELAWQDAAMEALELSNKRGDVQRSDFFGGIILYDEAGDVKTAASCGFDGRQFAIIPVPPDWRTRQDDYMCNRVTKVTCLAWNSCVRCGNAPSTRQPCNERGSPGNRRPHRRLPGPRPRSISPW